MDTYEKSVGSFAPLSYARCDNTHKLTTRYAIRVYSVFELGQQFFGISEGSSGLSVLRTFRLLRILKLVRFMPNLRRQLFVMLRTMDNVAIFFSLLILFIFIFR